MLCGYANLIEQFDIKTIPLRVKAVASSAVNKKLRQSNQLIVPERMAPPANSPFDHVLFAMKHEGVNLAVLSEVLPKINKEELLAALYEMPSSAMLHKISFLWEYFTKDTIDFNCPNKGYSTLFDGEKYITGPIEKNQKWKVAYNGIGPLSYCPTVEKTDLIKQGLEKNILALTKKLFDEIGSEYLDRALNWAYLSETKGTYDLERENVGGDKAKNFMKLLRHVKDACSINESYLCDLQNEIVNNQFNHAFAFRSEQNWLAQGGSPSALSVTYIPPSPEVICDLMDGYMKMINGWNGFVDPVISAAIASFGFVYLHPFMDGNGRLSRFLIHHQLSKSDLIGDGVILPISVALKKRESEYLEALKAFSAPARDLWDAVFSGGDPLYDFTFYGTDSVYRYWDATTQVEFFFDIAEHALNVHLREEVEYLLRFDEIERIVNDRFDIRNNDRMLLISVAMERNGELSKNIRRKFSERVPPEVFDFIEMETKKVLGANL